MEGDVNPLRWRKMTWVLLLFTGLMAVWIVSATSQADCEKELSSASQSGCEIGTGLGVTFLFLLWFVGFLILSIVWLMSRGGSNRAQRLCPVCGSQVKPGKTACQKCGYDFAAAARPVQPAPVIEATGHVQPVALASASAAPIRVCPTCGESDIPPGAKFCGSCGGAL